MGSAGQHYQPRCSAEWCSDPAASELRNKIEAYWRKRGFAIQTEAVDAEYVDTCRTARVDIRSNLINGLPPKSARIIRAAA